MKPELYQVGEPEKQQLPAKYLLFAMTGLCLVLMLLTFYAPFLSGPVNAVFGSFVTPVQKGITSVALEIDAYAKTVNDVKQLKKENKILQSQVDQLTTDNTNLLQDRYELQKLRELYQLDAQYEQYEKTGARVIAKDAGNWFSSFLIDKGSSDGIRKNMNVVAGSGLVGIVDEVGPSWARVKSIIADNSSVSGMVLSTSDNLIVNGSLEEYKNGTIPFSRLTDNADKVAVGEKIVTSNVSDRFLPGILIGYITSVSEDTNHLTKSGELTPAVDFEHISTVLVILETKDTGGE